MMVNGYIQPTPAPSRFTAPKEPRYPFNMRMGWPYRRLGCFTKKGKKLCAYRDFFLTSQYFPVQHIACHYNAARIVIPQHFQYSLANTLYIAVPIGITKHVSVNHIIYQYNTAFITKHVSEYHSVSQYNTTRISISQCLSV